MANKLFVSAVVLTAVAVAGTSVLAAGPRAGQLPSFEQLDADSDGRVTQSEMQAHRTERLQAADTDGDGQLSQGELEAMAHARSSERAARMLSRLDQDENGALSFEELTPRDRSGRFFDRMDRDGDGGLSQEEFDAAKAQMKDRRAGRHDR